MSYVNVEGAGRDWSPLLGVTETRHPWKTCSPGSSGYKSRRRDLEVSISSGEELHVHWETSLGSGHASPRSADARWSV